jgi:hypothetical protein
VVEGNCEGFLDYVSIRKEAKSSPYLSCLHSGMRMQLLNVLDVCISDIMREIHPSKHPIEPSPLPHDFCEFPRHLLPWLERGIFLVYVSP